jgi:hypothetical protein
MSHQTHIRLAAVAALVAGFAAACPCIAGPFEGAAPVGTATLESERAGFFTAAGVEFGFAATLQTMVDGQVALTTTLTLQDNGSVDQQTNVNPNLEAALNAGAPGSTTVTSVNGGQQLSAVTGLDLSGVQGAGIVIKSNSGITAVLNNIGANQFQNVVVNTANSQTITQNTAITVSLPAFSAAQAGTQQIMNGLSNTLQFALTAGAR